MYARYGSLPSEGIRRLWNERVRLMQHWANRLDCLRKAVAVPLRKSAESMARDSTSGSEADIHRCARDR